ncbi:pilus assembly protein CpaE [Pseudonocardia sp. MH-G8]|uniref:pilus assembly protein CpaE n=1 Tax=Pseudonocardia sp. MH-G8 TaxID=1854588 RepID=UPI000BA0F21D|nr:pilus assembly protein CpaE [Pseudonocardia sp. MH-G8]OZM76040.1 pilus assembly protein CpaE [Pseudonocardia sp. MH-G8]
MISVELALRLRAAGLEWRPRSGDRFVIPSREMDADVFVVSELTIDVHQAPTGPLIRFNGTTEWALDSVPQESVVWLPHEGQLREALGPRFRRLEPIGEGLAVVVVGADGAEERHVDVDAERAYARALLSVLGS